MASKFLIYGLIDPRTNELKYIGKSTSGLERPKAHNKANLLRKYKSKKNSWILSLKSTGLKPIIEVIEEFDSESPLNDAERFWIASIKATGADLLNMTDGGDGLSHGFVMSAETKQKMSIAQKKRGTNGLIGYKQTESHKRAISAKLIGRPKAPFTAEHRRNNALAQGGKPFKDSKGNLYYTIPEAVKATGFHYSTIARSLKRISKNDSFNYIEMEK